MFKRKKKEPIPSPEAPWQQAVLGKRIVGVDGIDDIPIGLILLEDGTALSLGMDMAGRDKYHFEFWPRQKTAEYYQKALAQHSRHVAVEIADKQRVESLVARVIPPLF